MNNKKTKRKNKKINKTTATLTTIIYLAVAAIALFVGAKYYFEDLFKNTCPRGKILNAYGKCITPCLNGMVACGKDGVCFQPTQNVCHAGNICPTNKVCVTKNKSKCCGKTERCVNGACVECKGNLACPAEFGDKCCGDESMECTTNSPFCCKKDYVYTQNQEKHCCDTPVCGKNCCTRDEICCKDESGAWVCKTKCGSTSDCDQACTKGLTCLKSSFKKGSGNRLPEKEKKFVCYKKGCSFEDVTYSPLNINEKSDNAGVPTCQIGDSPSVVVSLNNPGQPSGTYLKTASVHFDNTSPTKCDEGSCFKKFANDAGVNKVDFNSDSRTCTATYDCNTYLPDGAVEKISCPTADSLRCCVMPPGGESPGSFTGQVCPEKEMCVMNDGNDGIGTCRTSVDNCQLGTLQKDPTKKLYGKCVCNANIGWDEYGLCTNPAKPPGGWPNPALPREGDANKFWVCPAPGGTITKVSHSATDFDISKLSSRGIYKGCWTGYDLDTDGQHDHEKYSPTVTVQFQNDPVSYRYLIHANTTVALTGDVSCNMSDSHSSGECHKWKGDLVPFFKRGKSRGPGFVLSKAV